MMLAAMASVGPMIRPAHMRALISSDFAYVGIALIGSATVLDVHFRVRGRKSRLQDS